MSRSKHGNEILCGSAMLQSVPIVAAVTRGDMWITKRVALTGEAITYEILLGRAPRVTALRAEWMPNSSES
jgi:hypothetical protein